MSSTGKPPLIVVAGIFLRGDEVLACRRAPNKTAAGLWEFPGGKVELGEAPEDALVREILEELKIRVLVLELIDRSVTRVNDMAIDLSCYLIDANGAEPIDSTDHDLLRWVRRADLAALDWASPDLPAVAALISRST
ncbi:(deoxy)nucleoside triphosphate pyrophosphohydrolase [Pseudoclavibacter sp. JSM 162008]|uniref:(deoxy)nucleoside triphosphate pyrophosphohydrolase n=1 Tax=Pseudoclavibacter sp. JSM 162008 TaxID=3229855 RepID=UPI003526282D